MKHIMRALCLAAVVFAATSGVLVADARDEENLPNDPRHRRAVWYLLVESGNANVHEIIRLMQQDSTISKDAPSRQVQECRRWIARTLPHADAHGNVGPLSPPLAELLDEASRRGKQPESTQNNTKRWKPLGPFGWDTAAVLQTGSQGVGVVRTHLVWPGSPRLILAGTISAGIWRSTDAGRTWTSIANDEPIQTVSRFAVSRDTVYAATSAGLYVSTDRGLTFRRLSLQGDLVLTDAVSVDLCAVDPNDPKRIVISTLGRLFLSVDAGQSWKSASNMIGTWWDLCWHTSRSDLAYGLVQVGSHITFVRSSNSGVKFNQTGQGYPAARADASMARGLIALTPAAPRMVSVLLAGSEKDVAGVYGLYVSTDEGSTFEHRCCGAVDGPEAPTRDANPNLFDYDIVGTGLGQVTWDMGFAISSRDPQYMVAAGIFPYRSSDGGRTWRGFPAMHYDIQSVSVIGDSVWLTHDGGITLSSDRGNTISERSFGISASEVWGFDQSHDGHIMAMGAYHLPTFFRDTTVYASRFPFNGWYPWAGADAMGANVNPIATEWIYAKPWSNVRVQRTRSKLVPPTSSDLGIDLGYLTLNNIEFDPHLYQRIIAIDHGTQRVVESNDNGATWVPLRQFSRWVSRVRVHPEDGRHMMVIADNALWRSTDRGRSWSSITPTSDVSRNQGMVDVAFDDKDPDHVYAAFGGNQRQAKIAESTDGGQTWTSVSTGLPSFAIFTIVHRRGSDDELYAGTSYGVYRYTPATNWELFGAGLPMSDVNFLHIDDPGSRLRVATNRGLWEIDLPLSTVPRALISMDTDTVRCSRTPVRFGCRSAAVETPGFRRTWRFPSGIPSESSAPVVDVRYPTAGSYDVLLIVENEAGSDTLNMDRAVTVLPSECDVFSPVAGNAADLRSAKDHVSLGRFVGLTRNFSFTAWVKPLGLQPNFSAILCTDADQGVSQEIGLQFVNDQNELGYLWSGGRWWWASGLKLRSDEWSHVALTVDSTGATVYVNGIGSKDATPLQALDLSRLVFTLGTYHYWSERNFNGLIDEVALFDRTLTQDEIRRSMHLTRNSAEPGMLAYYQFNESAQGVIFDKAGGNDGRYHSGAGPTESGALVAAGTSQISTVERGMNMAAFEDLGDTVELYVAAEEPTQLVMTRFDRIQDTSGALRPHHLEHSWRVLNTYSSRRSLEVSAMRLSCDPRALAADALDRRYGVLTRSTWNPAEPWSGARIQNNERLELQGGSIDLRADRGLLTPLQIVLTYSGALVNVGTEDHANGLCLRPNPASDLVSIRTSDGLGRVAISTMDGRIVYSREFTPEVNEQGIDLSMLSQGTYVLTAGQQRRLLVIHR
jgi:photosystem II stability/assembly factor-like uncharacterized protein/PKD repeat protein